MTWPSLDDVRWLFSELIEWLNRPIVEGQSNITAMTVLGLLLLGWIALRFSRAAQRGVARANQRLQGGIQLQESSLGIAQTLVHYGILLVAVVIALQMLSIDVASLVAAGAVFAVGLSLALQNLAQNFVSGLILLFEQTLKPGDIVEVEGTVVRIRQLGARSTLARSRDGEDLIIPNNLLVQNTVKNLTHEDRTVRIRVPVGVSYDSDMTEVATTLRKVARNVPWRTSTLEPVVLLTTFGPSSVDWEVSVWGDDPWRLPVLQTDLAERIWRGLKEAGITIAFPQVDVHLGTMPELRLAANSTQDSPP
ncbi:MAG: mechanosensitive ion channel domain-containing protein [Myxococcota bacterium]